MHAAGGLRAILTLLVGVPLLVLGTAAPSHACSCVELTPRLLLDSDVAFSGTVEETGASITRLAVDQVWAGDVASHTEVVHGSEESACGLRTRVGERMLVGASLEAGDLRTTLCSTISGEAAVSRMALRLDDGALPRSGEIEATRDGPPIVWLAVGGLVLALAGAAVVRRRS